MKITEGKKYRVRVIDSNRKDAGPITQLIGKEYVAVGHEGYSEDTVEVIEPQAPFNGTIQLAQSEVEFIE